MKLLLTSAGVNNQSIQNALVGMLDKPIADSNALCIPTAMYGHPWVGPRVKNLRVYQREIRESHGRPRLEVCRRAGAHRTAKHQ
ncbi:hypothetical protein SAMN06272722_1171 [Paenibacillus sp. RU5A]|nr:hypothetical protein SAMN06272722_1171 [Paenibacillus sp. RU5A]SOC76281.1 hypothetical protein SAMN05880581_1171 [Paenibacillus sp. RU26A]SOC77978.1 hypothetical protein SAMN05880586_11780 [Paenibacillus sp. RU5M]